MGINKKKLQEEIKLGSLGSMESTSDQELKRRASIIFKDMDILLKELRETKDELKSLKEKQEEVSIKVNAVHEIESQVKDIHKKQLRPNILKRLFRRK